MTLQTLRSIHFGQVEAALKVDLLSPIFFEKKHKKMSDLKFIRNHSRKVPGAPAHQKTSSNIILSDPGPSGKN